jgi:hypothetical protein
MKAKKKRRQVSAPAPGKKRWTFKKSERPAGWTEEMEREWYETGPHVYDKAKWHYEGDYPKGLSKTQAFVHTGLFTGWLIEHDMITREFTRQFSREFPPVTKHFKQRKLTGPQAKIWGGCLDSEMLTPQANEFAQEYYDGDVFAKDYRKLLVRRLPSWYHVQDTWTNYDILARQINDRYAAWNKN